MITEKQEGVHALADGLNSQVAGDFFGERNPRAELGYKKASDRDLRVHPFNVLVQAHGRIYVRYNYTEIARNEEVVVVEDGDEGYRFSLPFGHLSVERTCGGTTVGFHHVPAGRFSFGKVRPDFQGRFDLDEIEAVVASIRADWGDLEVQMNIDDARLYRRAIAS